MPPRQRALAGLSALLTDMPWTLRAGDLDRLAAAGLGDEAIVQAVTISAVFNYLARIADGTGIDFDYESPLPRIVIDRDRPASPRAAREDWPAPNPAPKRSLSLRPMTAGAMGALRAYVYERDAPLSLRERALLGRTAALALCDGPGSLAFAADEPAGAREACLAAYADRLTRTPWKVGEADLNELRAHGLDDRGLLDVISIVAAQNAFSRVRLALEAPA
ncbi:MAG: hypothetical protein U0359_15600 [Byssovorax sp.]